MKHGKKPARPSAATKNRTTNNANDSNKERIDRNCHSSHSVYSWSFRFSVTLIGVIRGPVLAFALKIFAAHKEIDGPGSFFNVPIAAVHGSTVTWDLGAVYLSQW